MSPALIKNVIRDDCTFYENMPMTRFSFELSVIDRTLDAAEEIISFPFYVLGKGFLCTMFI